MTRDMTIRVHAIAEDGLPDMDALTGRVAFIFDGCIVSGWPLHVDRYARRTTPGFGEYHGQWEANSDVGHTRPFAGVTHWVEFPVPVWEIERDAPAEDAP
jgi:hypothetical protein